jgi:hypothetical protein
MNKLFVALTFSCLGIISVSIGVQEPSPSPSRSSGEERNANERCDCPPSPDGKFAFLTSDSEDSYIIDLIDKKSGKNCNASTRRICPFLGMCSGHPIRMGSP